MMPEERVVSQIRDFCRTENPEPNPEIEDLAEQYAELTEAVNQRLLKCDDFLDKGMRSEAVHEMQVPPPLLEQVNALNFREVTKWRNLCDDFDMRVFTPLRVDIVDRLRAEATTEEALAPLLKEYRRMVHQGSRDERIDILRKIREHDPENPVWHDNLAPLEDAQLQELIPKVEEALEKEDIPALARMRDDLEHPQRACLAPEELCQRVDGVLRASELREARVQADSLIADIESASEERDEARLEELLARWDRVTADADVQVDPNGRQRVENIRSWLHTEQESRAADQQFQNALAELESLVTQNLPDRDEVRRLWREVMTAGRPVPDDVRNRVMTAIANVERHERSARRRRALTATLVVLAVLVVASAVGILWHRAHVRTQAVSRVRSLVDNGDYRGAVSAVERLEEESPSLYAIPAIQQLRARAQTALEQAAERRSAFRSVMEQLKAIQRGGYEASESRIERLVGQAEELAVEAEQKSQLQSWRDSRELAELNEQRRRKVEFEQAVDSLRARVERRRQQQYGDFQQEADAIGELQQSLAHVREQAAGVSADSADRLDPVAEMLATWEARFKKRREQAKSAREKKERVLRAIANAPPDMDLFGTLMRGFLQDYPEDPRVASMRRVIQDIALFKDVLALGDFVPAEPPLSDAERRAASRVLQSLPGAERSLWHGDLSRLLSLKPRRERALEALKGIQELPGLDLKVFEVRPLGTQIWQKVYYPETIRNRDKELYWGKVYRTSPEEAAPWLEHRQFSAEDYEIRISRRTQGDLVPHARYARELVRRLGQREVSALQFLCDETEALIANEEVPAIPKAWFLGMFVSGLRQCAIQPVAELQKVQDLLDEIPKRKNWFHEDHPEVSGDAERVTKALAEFPDVGAVRERILRRRKLLRETLARKPEWVGRVVEAPDGDLTLDVPAAVPEVWVVRLDRTRRARRIHIVSAHRQGEGPVQLARTAEDHVYPGQLLFAPGDGRSTDDIATQLRATTEETARLSSWPRR